MPALRALSGLSRCIDRENVGGAAACRSDLIEQRNQFHLEQFGQGLGLRGIGDRAWQDVGDPRLVDGRANRGRKASALPVQGGDGAQSQPLR